MGGKSLRDTFIIISRSQEQEVLPIKPEATTYTLAAYILLLSVFLYGTGIPNLSLVCFFLCFPVIFFLKNKTVTVSFLFDSSLVFLFGFLYYTMSLFYGITSDVDWFENKTVFLIGNMALAYIIGFFLAQNVTKVNVVIVAMVGGIISFGLLSIGMYALNHFGDVVSSDFMIAERAVPSFWTGGIVNGPIIGIYLSLGICLVTMIYSRIHFLYKCLFIAFAVACGFFNLMLQNRSPIYAGIFALALATILYLPKLKLSRKKLFGALLLVCLAPVLLLFIDQSGVIGFLDAPFLERFKNEGFETPRYELWYKGVQGLLEFPMGGAKTDFSPFKYAHNLWLDVGWYVGLIPMFLLLFIQMKHLVYLYRFIKRHPDQSHGAIGITASFLVAMMVEPTLIASYTYITLFFFFIGYIKGYLLPDH